METRDGSLAAVLKYRVAWAKYETEGEGFVVVYGADRPGNRVGPFESVHTAVRYYRDHTTGPTRVDLIRAVVHLLQHSDPEDHAIIGDCADALRELTKQRV